jgi:hypothetical protein
VSDFAARIQVLETTTLRVPCPTCWGGQSPPGDKWKNAGLWVEKIHAVCPRCSDARWVCRFCGAAWPDAYSHAHTTPSTAALRGGPTQTGATK